MKQKLIFTFRTELVLSQRANIMSILLSIFFILSSAFSANPQLQKEMTIRPGEVRWVELELEGKEIKLFCRDEQIKMQREGKKVLAIIRESYFSELNPFTCQFKEKDQVLGEIFFKVLKREYKAEKLKVNPKTIKLAPEDQKRADDEQLILNRIWASSLNHIQFKIPFQEPMASQITSLYGTKRVYNKEKKGQHLGIDYRAAIGDKVPCSNGGKVVFAGDLFYTGLTIIIDHGMDIFSVYGHLSKILVEAGQFVQRAQVIGLSGNTGRTSGPHLHWGIKVQNQYIDGMTIIEETQKFFKE
jgi:murein DD-endopeptidase MepM/ murein hydrolase activator NlpD